MELAFSTKSVRQICERQARAREVLGQKTAEKLRRRLADLRAASSVKELVVGCHYELDGAPTGDFAVNLRNGARILCCANHRVLPRTDSGKIDWTKVNRIKIIEIEYE